MDIQDLLMTALRASLSTLALLLALLLVIAGLVQADLSEEIVPAPNDNAESIVRALGAGRVEGARQELPSELEQQVGDDELRALASALGQFHNGVNSVEAETTSESSDQATAQVTIGFNDGSEEEIELTSVKEQGLWKIDSLDPLRELVALPPPPG